jgi:hypothetical protein
MERSFASPVIAFGDEVGAVDPVTCVGGRTQLHVGRPRLFADGDGLSDESVALGRVVRAPAGIVSIDPAEMLVRVYAGTRLVDLADALQQCGQFVAFPDSALRTNPTTRTEHRSAGSDATVGGALAIGYSSPMRLGHGPLRDALLEATIVTGHGRLVVGGGPVVKNVTGYDLCRLLVGARGRLGFFAEVVLRTRPLPLSQQWFTSERAPHDIQASLWRPSALWWDGHTTWVCLEGHLDDIVEQATSAQLTPCDRPPTLPSGGRTSVEAAALHDVCARLEPGSFMAECGVGIIHHDSTDHGSGADALSSAALSGPKQRVHDALLHSFDPLGRLNPGVSW